jgi:hypothetical protein
MTRLYLLSQSRFRMSVPMKTESRFPRIPVEIEREKKTPLRRQSPRPPQSQLKPLPFSVIREEIQSISTINSHPQAIPIPIPSTTNKHKHKYKHTPRHVVISWNLVAQARIMCKRAAMGRQALWAIYHWLRGSGPGNFKFSKESSACNFPTNRQGCPIPGYRIPTLQRNLVCSMPAAN